MPDHSSLPQISNRLVLWMTYLLYFMFAPALIGFGINYYVSKGGRMGDKLVSRPQQKNRELLLSHHQWLMRTFVFVSTFIMIGIGTAYLGVGYFVIALAVAWWFYRVLKGMVSFAHSRSMPA